VRRHRICVQEQSCTSNHCLFICFPLLALSLFLCSFSRISLAFSHTHTRVRVCVHARRRWAEERSELIRSPLNRRSVDMIDSALFVVALDCGAHSQTGSSELSWGVTGAGEHRWWDKNFTLQVSTRSVSHPPHRFVRLLERCNHFFLSFYTRTVHTRACGACPHPPHTPVPVTTCCFSLTFVSASPSLTSQVDASGTPCVNFEHAPYDGATVVRMVEDAWHDAAGMALPSGRPMPQPPVAQTERVGELVPLPFELSPRTAAAVEKATRKCAAFTDISKFELLDFSRFGKQAIKGWRLSPDGAYRATARVCVRS
jgi:hypothetical protein